MTCDGGGLADHILINHRIYLWAKYELIWSDITAQTVTLSADLLVMAQTIHQNTKRVFFFKQKLRVLKIFRF